MFPCEYSATASGEGVPVIRCCRCRPAEASMGDAQPKATRMPLTTAGQIAAEQRFTKTLVEPVAQDDATDGPKARLGGSDTGPSRRSAGKAWGRRARSAGRHQAIGREPRCLTGKPARRVRRKLPLA